jgi:hypothetical protein
MSILNVGRVLVLKTPPALMITGLSAHPGRFPYGDEVRTRSTLSSHFSPSPPALRA